MIILGAAGRDFHNFNTLFRGDSRYEVIAFTAAQIPDIEGRVYPAVLAGAGYPNGIPIFGEEALPELIRKFDIDCCVFSYSDVSYTQVMRLSAVVQAAGASFLLPGPAETSIKSTKPVIAIGAVRTGAGKSQTARRVIELLLNRGLRVIAIRHPMPYGDLSKQIVQRFATLDDLKRHACTVEEMEEYEPHITRGNVVYAGVDYEAILRAAEEDPEGCDVIVWDGGNNDFPFYKTDLMITLVDPHRPGDEVGYYPGEVTLRMADVVIINKVDTAELEHIDVVRRNIQEVNPRAVVIDAASPIEVEHPEYIRNKRVLVVEDGPSLTHGGRKLGAGVLAAQKFGAAALVDPRPFLQGKMVETFELYPEIGHLLPAMGYSPDQLHDLEHTIQLADCDTVVIGTPIDLRRVIQIKKPCTRVFYNLQEIGHPNLETIISQFVARFGLNAAPDAAFWVTT